MCIRDSLSGAFGSRPDDVNAYAAATFYSVDRFASYRQDWGAYYEAGGLVIADRYTTSNAVHQTPKLPPEERRGYLEWLFDFEYRLLGLPKPDRVLYLDLPTEISERLMRRREQQTHTRADIHERDEAYSVSYTHLDVYKRQALTDSMVIPLLRSGLLRGGRLVVADPSKVLLKPDTLDKLSVREVALETKDAARTLCVTVNPVSAYGWKFDKDVFIDRMRQSVKVPVINVKEELA